MTVRTRIHAHLLAAATLAAAATTSSAIEAGQLGGFGCPLAGSPQIRQGDSIAASGGRFNSSRVEGKKHGALDLNSTVGTDVFAALDGTAGVAQHNWKEMGHAVIIDHGSGAYTVYGHLDTLAIAEGKKVRKGDKIGTVGYSGNAASLKAAGLPPHLHFALIQAGQSGLAEVGRPLRKMKEWADFWQSLGAELTGAVNPGLFMANEPPCWKGSTTVGAPGEK